MSVDWMLKLYSAWSFFLLEVVCTFTLITVNFNACTDSNSSDYFVIIRFKEGESEVKVTIVSLCVSVKCVYLREEVKLEGSDKCRDSI
jgi:hypothetical protein